MQVARSIASDIMGIAARAIEIGAPITKPPTMRPPTTRLCLSRLRSRGMDDGWAAFPQLLLEDGGLIAPL